jgi:hypothetical protein
VIPIITPKQRGAFWARVSVRGPRECWMWCGALNPGGYGTCSANGVDYLAHRFAFLLAFGKLPPVVRHRCDRRACCNFGHLLAGTHADNVRDMIERGRARFINPQRGEANGIAKLTADQVHEIRRRLASGERKASLARAFGVDPSLVWRIQNGIAWSHLSSRVAATSLMDRSLSTAALGVDGSDQERTEDHGS